MEENIWYLMKKYKHNLLIVVIRVGEGKDRARKNCERNVVKISPILWKETTDKIQEAKNVQTNCTQTEH